MFDFSFPELLLILVVALVVIGPERLPRVARTMGFWVGRARSVFNTVRRDVEREVHLDELKQAERDFRKDTDLGLDQDVMKGTEGSSSRRGNRGSRGRGSSDGTAARPSIADDGAAGSTNDSGAGNTGESRQGDDGNT